ncbi:MlaD family protein [Mycobacterium sp. 236(2023)]|uniref:MCE family protein n=1 Tax=Mycobacterium sp. 236(2023) TaxID=3038163 RepID=UPI0024154D77|nr:MlaD family protein [Mycobacterium sp. 236(2023)]MDG4668182.1 MlaD family protein [Mycobacterium sp. 236(2023)]
MLSRLVRIQLIIFSVASVVGITVMLLGYVQLPTLLGVGRMSVTLQLPELGGLYRFANVTYRGVQVGKVTEVDFTRKGADAVLSIKGSARIPANLRVEVRSMSAVGEQYVDLQPVDAAPPYLTDGSVITADRVSVPQPVGPMLDKTSELLASIPKETLAALIDESAQGLDGAGFDIGSLIDSSATLSGDAASVAGQVRALVDDSGPLLDGAAQSAEDTRAWASNLAGVTDQLVENDPQFRTILHDGPPAIDEVTRLLDQVKPTLPVLLANLSSVGQVGVTYLPALEQIFVLLPPTLGAFQGTSQGRNYTGMPLGNFRAQIADPPPCTVGFLPPSQWRSPADTTTIDTPDGLYCKLPQDSPTAVRGARNLPCLAHPGKRAPTVEICDSDKPFVPLAMREHILGPPPVDPNLIAQGIPLDSRVPGEADSRMYAPVEGTPLPPGAARAGAPPEPPPPAPVLPITPPTPALGVATYDPSTGSYVAPNGIRYQQQDLIATPSLKDLMLGPTR